MQDVVVGSPPTPQDEALIAAAGELTPDKSVAKLDGLAQYVLANTTLVAGTLTVLGIFTDLGDQFNDHPIAFVAPVVLVATSVLLALISLFPVGHRVNPADLTAVAAFYESRIRFKYLLVIGAFGALILAVAAALLPVAISFWGNDDPTPSMSLSWNETLPADAKSTTPTLSVTGAVKLENADPMSKLELSITATNKSGAEVVVSRSTALVGDSRDVELPVELGSVNQFAKLTLTADLFRDSNVKHDELELQLDK